VTQDLYTEIINSKEMTNTFDRDSLISDYAEQVVDDMDLKTLVQLAYDVICENMAKMTDNEIVEDVNNCYPELLQEYNIDPDMYL
jgi:predicted Zn-dependent protease with MMP-like domain